MTTTKKQLLTAVKAAVEAQGGDYTEQVADAVDFLVSEKAEMLSDQMGISPASVWTSYGDLFDADDISDTVLKGLALHLAQSNLYPAVTLSLADAGRVIASMGQAARMVSLNYEAFKKQTTRNDAIAVLDAAGDGTSMMGIALADSTDGMVTFDSAAVALAHQALQGVIDLFAAKEWTTGRPDLDKAVQLGMAQDLALLTAVKAA